MPTQRFLRLSQDKQDKILSALIDEFAELGIDGASVSGIIKRADIPRGSFYQYFEGLDEAVAYVHSIIMRAKQAYLAKSMTTVGKVPFFDFLSTAFSESLDFVAKNPKFAQIGSHMLTSKDEATKKMIQTARMQGEQFYAKLIQLDKDKGLIRSDVDPTKLSCIIMPLFFDLTVRLMYTDHMEFEEIKLTLDWALEIIKRGVSI